MGFLDSFSPDDLLEKGRQHHTNQNLVDALQCYQRVLIDCPGDSRALHLSGLIAHEWGKFHEALKLFDSAIQIDPYNYRYHNDKGLVYEQLNMPHKSFKSFKQALALEKKDGMIYFNIANILFDKNQFDEAIENYQMANSLQPQNVDILYNLASAYAARGNIEEAKMCLHQAIKIQPNYADGLVNLGVIEHAIGEIELAEQRYRDAIKIKPLLIEANINLANLLIEQTKRDDALSIYANLIDGLQHNKQIDEALSVLIAAIGEFPGYFQFEYNAGTICLSIGDYASAAAHFKEAVKINPNHALSHNNLGLIEKYSGNYQSALNYFLKAIQIDEMLAIANNNLGNLYAAFGKSTLAVEQYEKSLDINSNDVNTLSNLVSELTLLERLDDAKTILNKIIEIDENNHLAKYSLSCIYLSQNKFSEAWPLFESRYASNPENSLYYTDPRTSGSIVPRPSSLKPFNIRGSVILLLNDLDLARELLFLRFVDSLKNKGAFCYYLPKSNSESFLIEASDLDLVTDLKMIPNNIDYILGISELPLILDQNCVDKIPAPFALIPPKKAKTKVEKLLNRLPKGKPILGVTWNVSEHHSHGNSEIDPYLLGVALSDWKGEVVILEKNPETRDMLDFYRGLGKTAYDFSSASHELPDLLALFDVINEYVGVDNSHIFLRESVGKSSRMLLSNNSDWYMQTKSNKSPWLDNTKIYHTRTKEQLKNTLSNLKMDIADASYLNGIRA